MIAIFPEIAACAAKGDSEKLAVLIRSYFGGEGKHMPCPDIAEFLRNAGMALQFVRMDDYGALLARDEAGRFEIVAAVRDSLDPATQRFLLAHMMGHFLFDVQPAIARGDWTVSGFRETHCPLRRFSSGVPPVGVNAADLRKEERADLFAASLLMPKGMLLRARDKLKDLDRVALFFGLPRSCIMRRLDSIGEQADISLRLQKRSPSVQPENFIAAEKQMGLNPVSDQIRTGARQDHLGRLARDINPADDLIAPPSQQDLQPSLQTPLHKSNQQQLQPPSRQVAQKPSAAPRSIPVFDHQRTDQHAPQMAGAHRQGAGGVAVSAQPGSNERGGALQKGMDRIRQIARLLDKED